MLSDQITNFFFQRVGNDKRRKNGFIDVNSEQFNLTITYLLKCIRLMINII